MTGQVQYLTVEGFRSIRNLDIEFGNVNLITGPNGCGKSNLFNAFRLVKAAVEGKLSQGLAAEGSLSSIVWAGPKQQDSSPLKLKVQADPFDYSIELGHRPQSEEPLFPLDPQIKEEVVKLGGQKMVERGRSVAKVRALGGAMDMKIDLIDTQSIFSQIGDAGKYSYLYDLRELVHRWTFYHEFRTDPDSPVRRPSLPTFSPRLAEDGSNLGPSLLIINRYGDFPRLDECFRKAFPGADLIIEPEEVKVSYKGLYRSMGAPELSDGTLKFLCLAAACFSTRPAPLIAFNEPEISLNPAAIEPLADMLAFAAQSSQLWITTHSEALTKAMVNRLDCVPIRLDKVDGETMLAHRAERVRQLDR